MNSASLRACGIDRPRSVRQAWAPACISSRVSRYGSDLGRSLNLNTMQARERRSLQRGGARNGGGMLGSSNYPTRDNLLMDSTGGRWGHGGHRRRSVASAQANAIALFVVSG